MKNKFKFFLIVISLFLNYSCTIDKVTDLTIINRSKKCNYLFFYEKTENDTLAKERCLKEIEDIYIRWKSAGVNQLNYLNEDKRDSLTSIINKNGGTLSIIDSHFNVYYFCFIDIDALYENYQKGLPVDSFNSYEIKKYTREEVKKANCQIVIED